MTDDSGHEIISTANRNRVPLYDKCFNCDGSGGTTWKCSGIAIQLDAECNYEIFKSLNGSSPLCAKNITMNINDIR